MARSVSGLDYEGVNSRPSFEHANSPFVLVNHALGACLWWTEHVVLGFRDERDRAAEFEATGTVADLVVACDNTKVRLTELAPDLAEASSLQGTAVTQIPLGLDWTVGAALMHTYEELAQHLGHLEITVDLLGRSGP